MTSLYVIIPIAILILALSVFANLWLKGNHAEDHSDVCVSKSTDITVPNSHRLPTTYSNNALTKWIDIAWENTWTLKVRRFYWEADRFIRELLKGLGWE